MRTSSSASPAAKQKDKGVRLMSKIRHRDIHTHEGHVSKNTNGNTCRHVFGYSNITHQKPTRGWLRFKKKWDSRHSQGPLPPSSTRNICGLWNLNTSYHCEMKALPRTAENSPSFLKQNATKTNKKRWFCCFSCCIYSLPPSLNSSFKTSTINS